MPNQTPLAPTAPALSVTVYIVLNDFGPLVRLPTPTALPPNWLAGWLDGSSMVRSSTCIN